MSLLGTTTLTLMGVSAVAYAALASRVSRSGPKNADSIISVLLVLIAALLAGAAFSYGASNANLYGIGRTLTFFAGGFIPVVFYAIYREYTVGRAHATILFALCIVPVLTVVLSLTNSMHSLIWTAIDTPAGLVHSRASDHVWYRSVYAPFTYGLFSYTVIALTARLPSIAPAHRKTILLLLTCAALPFAVSVANNLFGLGEPDFPFTATTLSLVWPCFAYASLKMRVHEFSPLAYQTLFDHVRDPIFVVDNQQRIICANRAAQGLLQGTESELLGRRLWEEFPAARAVLEQARELDLTQTLRMNTDATYEVSVGPLSGPRGQNLGMVVVCRDVTERRNALSQLAESEHLVRTLIETSSNGILRFARDEIGKHRDFRCVFANKAAESFLGDNEKSLVGMQLKDIAALEPARLLKHFADDNLASTQVSFEVSVTAAKVTRWLRIVAEPVGADFSITLIDITERKQDEDKMLADALLDPLTGVLNRRGFEQLGAEAVSRGDQGAVLYLDLNGFKSVNDQSGHQVGDALLKAFGHRLQFCLRPEDVLGRLGGDEFAVVLPDVGTDDVRRIVDRLQRTTSEAYIIQGAEIRCTASIGIAQKPQQGAELWQLLSVADKAMYATKSAATAGAANDSSAEADSAAAS